ncbi:Swi5-domain-containing protein [Elsinoe ampelina]|uniref:Swi5-domain-containing protein n=1 Tax=Elsinoe ampelina TaxID=302913 RepID=A0A6A6GK45_9PEZI|nr:Swi5-domain-containing protein [Elsinoe ampelina]
MSERTDDHEQQQLDRLAAKRDDLVRRILATNSDLPHFSTSQTVAQPNNHSAIPVTDEQVREALAQARKARVDHVKLLGRYNDIKDVAQGLIGMIAEQRSCRVKEVMEELGIDEAS